MSVVHFSTIKSLNAYIYTIFLYFFVLSYKGVGKLADAMYNSFLSVKVGNKSKNDYTPKWQSIHKLNDDFFVPINMKR